jgi:ATP phosphoribosyltransferase regulatory subunit
VDLLALAGLSSRTVVAHAILAPWESSASLKQAIAKLRSQGEIVIESFPGHQHNESSMVSDRQLVFKDDKWQVVPK